MACEGAKELFEKYAGTNKSLSKEEFKKMIEEVVDNPQIRAKILDSDIFKAIDQNDSGEINLEEFEKFWQFVARCKQMMQSGGMFR